ncbi:ArnT family glycosyltransferase [Janibacter alkaliphilus]|uniref:4-amino-4-deoxy-L-arabinose transferase-like glycosyltransferase n=1 Tax=Janibacter alkaliphilus TaxID=1069963 RepID=A0A852XC91_9MICO|nr:glycosyltransferase family 39 protein [Janibacter alkaliphilus]NYG36111.1 4-amino-4-deoxy-L-arabinose transferase-like glycosyltransferase [Janibacter alkaliphilus]
MASTTLARTSGSGTRTPFVRPAGGTDRSGDGARPTGRLARLWRGPADDPAWARPALLALLALTLVTYTWNLTASGWANSFYSAAVQAGSESWTAFFYGSSDAANAITVDKPPASLWVMALSVRIFGLSSAAILMPQVLMGVATTGVVAATVKRVSGPAAGLLAGAIFALTPVAVLMFRFNNPDALLTLLMALGAWATMKAVEKGSIRWMALVGVLLGLGFLTKTLQVLLVVPFFGIAYLVAAQTTLKRRILGSLAGIGAMIAAGGWWAAIVELVPEDARPYIGGSQTNSFLELTFDYNGLGRLNGEETGSVGGGGGWGETGITRMFSSAIGGQISWLIPAALILLVAGLWARGRAPRTDGRRAGYLVWGGWLLVTLLTFSFMAGIFHEYYTVALAPAIGALVGMGVADMWDLRHRLVGRLVLAAALAATAVWGFVLLSRTTEYGSWLRFTVLALGLATAALIVVADRLHRRTAPVLVAAALVAALAGPTAYTVTTLSEGHSGSIVTAGPSTGGGMGGGPGGGAGGGAGGPGGGTPPGGTQDGTTQGMTPPSTQDGTSQDGTTQGTAPGGTGQTGTPQAGGGGMGGLLDASTPSTEVVAALSADSDEYTWVAAAVGSQSAAGLQLGTELPVMSIGGFNGSDPSPTLEEFQQYVADGEIHYLLASSGMGGMGGSDGGSDSGSEILEWAAASYTEVTIGSQTFYDLTQPLESGSDTSSTEAS